MERPRKTGTSNLRWRRDMHEFLMAFLVDQVKKGLKIDKTFKKQAFKAAVKAVNERFDVEVSKANIENHLKTIKAKHVTVKRLLSTNGTTFDPDKKQINMSPEALRKHLKVRPNDDTYLNKPIEFFDEMNIICGDNYVNGSFAKGITDTIKIDVDMASPEILGPFVDAVNGGTTLFITDGDGCDDPLMDNGNGDGVPLLNDDTVGINNFICEDATDVNPITNDCNFAAIGAACTPDAKPGFSDTSYKDTGVPPKRKTSLLLNDDTVGIDNLISEDSGDVNPMTDDYNFVAATDADCTHAKPGVSGTSCKDIHRPRKSRKAPNVRWRTDMSQFLMASLVDQAKKGHKFDKFFRKEAYVAAARAVNERFDAEVSESNVENHLKTIKANYAAIKRLLDTPGVVFDPDLKQINMDPDDVKKHLKAYPNDDRFLNKPIMFFDEMAIICGDIQVTTTHDKGVRDDTGIASQDNASPSMDEDNIGLNDVEFTQLQDNRYPSSVSATTEKTPSSRKRTRNSEILVLRDIASSICDLVSAIKASLSNDFANELYAEVMKCEGFEEEALGMAFDYLMENEMRARSFLAKSKSLRQSWMTRYLQGSQH